MIQPISSSLVHRILSPENSTAALHPTVIYIHGLGADEEDLLGLSGSYDPRLMSISVRAPFPLDYGGYAWYDFQEAGQPEPAMFKQSYEALSQFVHDASLKYPIDPKQLYLFGFSMGTVMSLAMALTQPELFRGVVANSGCLAERTHLTYRWNELRQKNFFVGHGLGDPLIPVEASRITKTKLEEAQAAVEYHEYDMAHQISNEGIADIAAWLNNLLNQQP